MKDSDNRKDNGKGEVTSGVCTLHLRLRCLHTMLKNCKLNSGRHKAALKPVNCEKLQQVIQDKPENPSQFLEHLTKALLQYTNLDPKKPEGKQFLMIYLFSQSFSDENYPLLATEPVVHEYGMYPEVFVSSLSSTLTNITPYFTPSLEDQQALRADVEKKTDLFILYPINFSYPQNVTFG
ncbi:hypothetical protein STEG23_015993 [Scotinomys teguina]